MSGKSSLYVPPFPAFSAKITPLRSTAPDRWALARIRGAVKSAPLRFVLWDGFELLPASGPPVASFIIRNRAALYSWIWDPEFYFGEAYMFDAVEIHGDLLAALEAIYGAFNRPVARWGAGWQRANRLDTAKDNVHRHYDLGNDFYRLWLDREMLYTCAYFPDPQCSLEDAQIAKMDLVCRKLALQPGERVVDAGCGWGSLALFMAKRYGVRVQAFNVSAEQIRFARARAQAERLDDLVEFVEDDYRNIRGTFDVFVSVGMLEHVGLPDYPTLGSVINRVLPADGRGLLHFIGRNQPAPLNRWISTRIFPGAYPPTLGEVEAGVLEAGNLSVLDVENLRLHYAKTLDHWRQRFEHHADRITAMFDDTFVRAWRLYLTGSQAAFSTGWMQLFQVVFARGGTNRIPWTRYSG